MYMYMYAAAEKPVFQGQDLNSDASELYVCLCPAGKPANAGSQVLGLQMLCHEVETSKALAI